MKKLTLTALVLGVVLAFAMPAMALDFSATGYMYASGYLEKKAPMTDAEDDYNAYYDFRWRIDTTTTVSDMLRMRSRTRVFNTTWGSAQTDEQNIEFERAWMLITTPYGLFEFGKMTAGAFGNAYGDNEGPAWRAKFTGKFGPLTTVGVVQKVAERDGVPANFTLGDQDADLYALALVYPQEAWTAGLLNVYVRDHSQPAPAFEDRDSITLNPFFNGKFGALGLQAEARFDFGDANTGGDYEGINFNIEGNYDIGMANLMLGFAYASGEDETTVDVEASGSNGAGDDWEKTFILFGSTGASPAALGGVGNFTSTGGNNDGFWTVYAGADTNVTEKLNVGIIAAWAQVDEPNTAAVTGIDDEAGVEVNLRATWQIYDNLSYTVIGAYLFAGDYWDDLPSTTNDDDPWAIFHRLQLSF